MNNYNETLESLANFSFPSNHLLTIGMTQRIVPADKTDYKDKIIYFVSLIPGETQQGMSGSNNRTYNFQGRITQKYSVKEILALSFALKQAAEGNFRILPFQKYTTDKQSSVWIGEDKSNNEKSKPTIMFTMTSGTNKPTIKIPFCEAYGIGEMLYELGKRGIEKEIEIQSVGGNSNPNGGKNYNDNETTFGSPQPENSSPFGTGFNQQSNNNQPGSEMEQFSNEFEDTIMNASKRSF